MSTLHALPIWLLTVGFGAILAAAAEVGFRLGGRSARRETQGARDAGGTIKNAVWALAALVLAFSYAMAAGRYDLRNQVVLRESNALGTCWLRTDFLPEEPRERARSLLRSIVDTRLRLFETALEPGRYEIEGTQLSRLENELWKLVSAESDRPEQPIRMGLLIEAVNEVIDSDGARCAAIQNRVPEAITLLLILCVTLSVFLMGHSSGIAKQRQWLLWSVMITLMVSVFTLAEDLDRPRRGLIQLDHSALTALRASMGP